MPVLDWAKVATPAPSNGFRLYWEITGPLTVAVLLFGLYWLFWESFASRLHSRAEASEFVLLNEPVDHGGTMNTLRERRLRFRDFFKGETYQINVMH
jgi:hypothetical protein